MLTRVVDEAAMDHAARGLRFAGIEATEPRYYPEHDEATTRRSSPTRTA